MPPDAQIAPASQAHDQPVALETPELSHVLLPLDCLGVQGWHLPYAEALIEEVGPFLPIVIMLAERAILNRYFELHGITGASEERRDLWRAVEELRKLKKRAHRDSLHSAQTSTCASPPD